MSNREKVIKGLECCTSEDGCRHCPYREIDGHVCSVVVIRDAIALLREQEAVKPRDWTSVADALPEDDTPVLAVKQLKNGTRDICIARCIPNWEHFDITTKTTIRGPYWVCGGNNNIIYWAPLPAIPE